MNLSADVIVRVMANGRLSDLMIKNQGSESEIFTVVEIEKDGDLWRCDTSINDVVVPYVAFFLSH